MRPPLRFRGQIEPGIGPKGAFDDTMREYACFLPIGDQLHAWYTGNGYGTTGIGHVIRPWTS